MLAIQLKNYLENLSEDTNILIFTAKEGEPRQLIMSDLNLNSDGNIVIDAEYIVPVKHTTIERS
jgi:hypothetical protein